MPRPTLLVLEPEPLEALSTRKLVLEAAKFNVVTAHSEREGLDVFDLFPNISMAVLAGGETISCDPVAQHIKRATDKIPIVFLSARIGARCEYADHTISSHEPETLVELVRSILGDPRQIVP